MELITSLLLGAIGGNIGGTIVKKISLGPIGNSTAGIVGGGIGAQIIQSAAMTNHLLASVIGGAAGGMLVMVLIGIIKHSWSQANT